MRLKMGENGVWDEGLEAFGSRYQTGFEQIFGQGVRQDIWDGFFLGGQGQIYLWAQKNRERVAVFSKVKVLD